MTLVDLLNRIGEYTDLDRLDAALTNTPVAGAAPMPEAERDIWMSGTSPGARRSLGASTVADVQRADVAALQVRTLENLGRVTADAAGMAERLGKAESTVSRMVKRGVLRPVQLGSRRRYPLWQVENGTPVPHVADVCDAAEQIHLHPLSMDEFMRRPLAQLSGRTPVEWLIEGGAPDQIVGLIDSLHR